MPSSVTRRGRVTMVDPPATLGIVSKTIGFEIAGSYERVVDNVGPPADPRREKARRMLGWDSVLFIPLYVASYCAVGVLLARRDYGGTRWLGLVIVAAAVLTASLDFAENRRSERLLDAGPGPQTDDLARSARSASLLKWAAAFSTTALCSVPFLVEGGLWRTLVGAGVLFAAFTGLLAVLLNLRQWAPGMLAFAFQLTGLAVAGALAAAIVLEVNA